MAREFVSLYRRNGGFNPAETGLQGNNEHICTMSPYYGESPVCKECVMSFFLPLDIFDLWLRPLKKNSVQYYLNLTFLL